jgi:hypothetical protein
MFSTNFYFWRLYFWQWICTHPLDWVRELYHPTDDFWTKRALYNIYCLFDESHTDRSVWDFMIFCSHSTYTQKCKFAWSKTWSTLKTKYTINFKYYEKI